MPTAEGTRPASGFHGVAARRILIAAPSLIGSHVETHGPLGTLWAGLGLGAFFIALTWVNLLLGHFLTPLFLIPTTWLMDAMKKRKERTA